MTPAQQLVEPQDNRCSVLGGRCMQRSACVAESNDTIAVSLLWANDCAFNSGEICCGQSEKWVPCQLDLGGECESPANCEFPRQLVPSSVKTNCGDALRPGTVCCVEPLTS